MKKIILALLGLIICFSIICVFFIGGKLSAYIWCIAVFFTAPFAVVIAFIQIINVVIRILKKKTIFWNILFIFVSIVYAAPVLVLLGISPITYPTLAKESDTIEALAPVENAVYFGGKEYRTHAYWPSECYAYDIIKKPYDIGSSNLRDYGIYGNDVRCPVNGTIIGVENDEPDIVPNSKEFTSSLGNYIFIKVDNSNTYIIMAHFMKESIVVSVGEHVKEGVILGKVGNSGTTSEPHLHIQHQRDNPLNMKFPICAESLPITFKIQQ